MDILFVVIYCCGFGMTTQLCWTLEEAKHVVRSIKESSLASINHFIPIQVVKGKDEILKAVQNYINTEFNMGAAFMQGEFHEWHDYICDILNYINYKQPGWTYLKEKYQKLYPANNLNRLDVHYNEWDFSIMTIDDEIEIEGYAGWDCDQQVPEYGKFGKSKENIMDAYYQVDKEIELIKDDKLRRNAYIALRELMFTYLFEKYVPEDKIVTCIDTHEYDKPELKEEWIEYYYQDKTKHKKDVVLEEDSEFAEENKPF